jgi:hypothetical protein
MALSNLRLPKMISSDDFSLISSQVTDKSAVDLCVQEGMLGWLAARR